MYEIRDRSSSVDIIKRLLYSRHLPSNQFTAIRNFWGRSRCQQGSRCPERRKRSPHNQRWRSCLRRTGCRRSRGWRASLSSLWRQVTTCFMSEIALSTVSKNNRGLTIVRLIVPWQRDARKASLNYSKSLHSVAKAWSKLRDFYFASFTLIKMPIIDNRIYIFVYVIMNIISHLRNVKLRTFEIWKLWDWEFKYDSNFSKSQKCKCETLKFQIIQSD